MSAPVAVGVAAAALTLGVPLLVGAGAVSAAARAASAADAAALAAADAEAGLLESGEWIEPCALASEVAASNGAELVFCRAEVGGAVRVGVVVRSGVLSIERRARAGSPES